eukprot:4687281-Pleurochrysis_carterae.AAC.4
MDGFSDPNVPKRDRFPQLHQPAHSHREARTHTVLIAMRDWSSISARPSQPCPDHRVGCAGCTCGSRAVANPTLYAGAGNRSGGAYFHWNPAKTLVSSIEVQLTALQGDMSHRAIDLSAVLGFVRNQMYLHRQRNPVSLAVPTALASPGDGAYVQFRGAPTTGQTVVSSASQAQPQQIDYPA